MDDDIRSGIIGILILIDQNQMPSPEIIDEACSRIDDKRSSGHNQQIRILNRCLRLQDRQLIQWLLI